MALPWHGGFNGASHRLRRLCLALLTVSSGAASALAEEAIRWQRVDGVVVSGSGLAKAPGATVGGGTSAQVVILAKAMRASSWARAAPQRRWASPPLLAIRLRL